MTKKVLITGEHSYIGESFLHYCQGRQADLDITEMSVRGEEWQSADFSAYDSIFHVAGIAHNSSDASLKELYYEVNCDLTIAVAKKAKEAGVKQFIFMSSMIVYGTKNAKIDVDTVPNPDNFYGDSKLQAEAGLKDLETDLFKVVILRPPMIYGPGSKGNYPLLAKFARNTPIFPDYPNKGSMLYIENLCEFVRLMIENEEAGTFHPQNKELVQTSVMVKSIAEHHQHMILFTRLFNPLIRLLGRVNVINKVFGDLYYAPELLEEKSYQIYTTKDSIRKTEEANLNGK